MCSGIKAWFVVLWKNAYFSLYSNEEIRVILQKFTHIYLHCKLPVHFNKNVAAGKTIQVCYLKH